MRTYELNYIGEGQYEVTLTNLISLSLLECK